MKKSLSTNLLLISCLLIIVSCKAKKHIVANTPPAETPPVAVVKGKSAAKQMDAVKSSQLAFNTFSGKANAKLDIDGSKNDAVLNIHINHDKEIWVSVSVTVLITVEVARAVITPDSILVINKLQGMYLKKPFSYIYQYANKQINYKMLEALLVGNALPDILKDNNASFQSENGNVAISGSLEDLVYNLMLGPNMKAGQLNLSNHNQAQSLQVTNNGFITVDNRLVPSQIDIQSTSQNKKIKVNLQYTKVDLDQQLQYPFSIPERYKSEDGN
jgi:hypothetical protein